MQNIAIWKGKCTYPLFSKLSEGWLIRNRKKKGTVQIKIRTKGHMRKWELNKPFKKLWKHTEIISHGNVVWYSDNWQSELVKVSEGMWIKLFSKSHRGISSVIVKTWIKSQCKFGKSCHLRKYIVQFPHL